MELIVTLVFYFFSAMLLVSGGVVITARNPVHSVLFLIYAFFNAAGLFVILGAEFLAMLLVIVYVGAVAVLFLFVVMMMDINARSLRRTLSVKAIDFFRSCLSMGGLSLVFSLLTLVLSMGFLSLMAYLSELFPTDTLEMSFSMLLKDPRNVFTLPVWSVVRYLLYYHPFSVSSLLMVGGIALSLWVAKGSTEKLMGRSFKDVGLLFIKTFPVAWLMALVFGGQITAMAWMWYDSSVTLTLIGTPQLISEPNMPNTQALGQVIYTDYLYIFQLSGIILLVAMIGAIVLTLRHREGVKRQKISQQVNRHKKDTLKLKDIPLGTGL